MEAAGEEELGLLSKIKPPRLEDAGLEDCALPPDSIHLAFLKAASAVGSRASSVFSGTTKTEGCVSDPTPPPPSDTLGGVQVGSPPADPCARGKGGAWVGGGDGARDLVGELNDGEVEGSDEVVMVGGEERDGKGRGCVDGLGGLGVKEKNDGGDDDDGSDDKKPTLVEGYFLNP